MLSKRNAEIAVVYVAGFLQGICFVTFPALGNVFKNPSFHNLTDSEFGSLFLPMIGCAILSSGFAGILARLWGIKRIFLLGIFSYVLAMFLLILSSAYMGVRGAAYGLALVSIVGVGLGIGTTLTALNTYAAAFFPGRSEAALTGLYGIMGMGMAAGPLVVGAFIGLGAWWGMPLLIGAVFMLPLFAGMALPMEAAPAATKEDEGTIFALAGELPQRFWIYACALFLYGVCETVFGNWTVIYLHEEKGLSSQWAGFALSTYWGMLTAGRLLVAVITIRYSVRGFFVGMPVLITATFLLIPGIGGNAGNVAVFALGGLACSAFLPLSVSFAEQEFPDRAELVAGWMITSLLVGVGVGAYGVGPLREATGLSFSAIYANSSLIAAMMAAVAFYLMRTRRAEMAGIA